jgi:hypothetical protein
VEYEYLQLHCNIEGYECVNSICNQKHKNICISDRNLKKEIRHMKYKYALSSLTNSANYEIAKLFFFILRQRPREHFIYSLAASQLSTIFLAGNNFGILALTHAQTITS